MITTALLKFLHDYYGPIEKKNCNDMLFHSDTLQGSKSKHRPVKGLQGYLGKGPTGVPQ
jgi:hypothetical protein